MNFADALRIQIANEERKRLLTRANRALEIGEHELVRALLDAVKPLEEYAEKIAEKYR